MISYAVPILMIVASNVFYNLLTKSMPETANPYAALVVTYIVSAALCFVMLLVSVHGSGVVSAFKTVNWTSIGLGVSIISLELGYIFAYRAGWNISICSLVANISLAVILLVIGVLFYKEKIGGNQAIGIILCLGGLFFLNRRA